MIVNVPVLFAGMVAWGTIGLLAYRNYQKQLQKPKIWKVLVILWVGLFSFSLNGSMFDTIIKFPILPLGVWILYFLLKGKEGRWQTYRSYAWLGFFANFIFLLSTLVTIPIQHALYPENEPSTYLANVENASIIPIHPSAENRSLHTENLLENIHTSKQERIYSDQWYMQTYMDTEPSDRNERFPYLLIGATPKWGSGLRTMMYIEDDGKGILVSTPKKQFYFRTDDTLIKGDN